MKHFRFALGSENAFHIEARTPGSEEYGNYDLCLFSLQAAQPFLTPHTAKAIDRYIHAHIAEQAGDDPCLQDTIEGIFQR
jgi:hypothetical protein